MTFDPTKPYTTRDGRKANIVAHINAKTGEKFVAVIEDDDGSTDSFSFFKDGKYMKNDNDDRDLINVPETKSWWVNVYANGIGFHPTEYAANKCAMVDRITLLEIRMCDGKHVDTIQHEVEK